MKKIVNLAFAALAVIAVCSCSPNPKEQSETGETATVITEAMQCELVKLAIMGAGKYENIHDFSSGRAAFYTADGLYGYVDSRGKEVIPATYKSASAFQKGVAIVSVDDEKSLLIDTTGKVVNDLGATYKGVWFIGNNALLMVENKAGKRGVIDPQGTVVIPFEYDGFSEFEGGIFRAVKGDNAGFIDKTGKVLVDFKYQDINSFVLPGAGYLVSDGTTHKSQLLDATGKFVKDIDAESIMAPSAGIIVVAKTTDKEGTQWGAMNYKGDFIAPYGKYYAVSRADDETGLAAVGVATGAVNEGVINLKVGYIDATGKEVIPTQFDDMMVDFTSGRAAVEIKGKKGYIDKTGKLVIPAVYDVAKPFNNGYAIVRDTLGYATPIDMNGNEVTPVLPE